MSECSFQVSGLIEEAESQVYKENADYNWMVLKTHVVMTILEARRNLFSQEKTVEVEVEHDTIFLGNISTDHTLDHFPSQAQHRVNGSQAWQLSL